MPSYKAPLEDYNFILHEMLEVEKHFPEVDKSLINAILEEGAKFCENALFPLNHLGDRQGLRLENGVVKTPDGFKEAYAAYCESGWGSLSADPEYGGQGLPEVINMPFIEMVCSSNLSFGLTPGLTHGAYHALHLHGNEEQKRHYLPKLISGQWSGVMCLTEPQAGTDLGLIRTKAEPMGDGSYAINGGKIFISSGEHDMAENIVHLVLARLPDAPHGVKGISLFVVPKFLLDGDGNITNERNKFSCSAIEHKMGIHASPTCVMNYDGAKGWLVGEKHKGLKAMFTMMNTARIFVGVQGQGIAEIAYQNALAYAKERLQGRDLKGAINEDKPADPITVHPDVRKMLMTMKVISEGNRALALLAALHLDIIHRSNDEQEKQDADDFIQIMTPVIKSFMTDMGFEMSSLGMQVLGGYGYIEEYGMAQYLRDSRITMIYEGTNGVQAMDLIGRKITAHNGRYMRAFFHKVATFIDNNKEIPIMHEFIKPLEKYFKMLQQATIWIMKHGLANPYDGAAAATEYQRMMSLVAVGWLWAWMAKISLEKDDEFHQAKVASARFYMQRILPQVAGLFSCMANGSTSIMGGRL